MKILQITSCGEGFVALCDDSELYFCSEKNFTRCKEFTWEKLPPINNI